jgi:hypothetical protein
MQSVVGAFLSPVASALGVFKKPKAAKPTQAAAARDDTLRSIAQEDALAKRRGGAADILTGAGGAEAGPASAKDLLGQ